MKIDDLKNLEKLFKLCRKHGVTDMSVDGVAFKITLESPEVDPDMPNAWDEVIPENPYENFPQEILTPEQLSHYASGGSVEDDPLKKD
jgi:hypothetical protein